MAKAKKSIYFCQNCGHEETKWLGQCPMCKEWNTFVEEKVTPLKGGSSKSAVREAEVTTLNNVTTDQDERMADEHRRVGSRAGGRNCAGIINFGRRRPRDWEIYIASASVSAAGCPGKKGFIYFRGRIVEADKT